MDSNLFTPEISDALITRLDPLSIDGNYLGRLYYTSSKDEDICSRVSDILSSRLKEDANFKYLGKFLNEFRNDIDTFNKSSFLKSHIDRFFPFLFFNRVKDLGLSTYEYHRFSVPFRAALFTRVSPQNRLVVSSNIIKPDNFFFFSLEFICLTIWPRIKGQRERINAAPLAPLYEYAADYKNWEHTNIDYRTSTVLLLMAAIQYNPPYNGAYKDVPELTLTKELWEKIRKANDNDTMTALMLRVIYDEPRVFGFGPIQEVFCLLLQDETMGETNWEEWEYFFKTHLPQENGNGFWVSLMQHLKRKRGDFYYYFKIRSMLQDIIYTHPDLFK